MKVLLTGATGYIGRYLLAAAAGSGIEWILLVRDGQKAQAITGTLAGQMQIILLTATDWKAQVKASHPEVVVHLASFLSSEDDEKSIDKLVEANLHFGTQLLDALRGTSLRLFINTGTFAEYSGKEEKILEPAYLYAATKTAYRSILAYYQRVMRFNLVHVIPYTVYGRQGEAKKLIDYIFDSLGAAEPLSMSPGEQVLDFIHIDDVVRFYLHLIQYKGTLPEAKSVFHLGTCTGTTPRELCRLVEDITRKKANITWGGRPYRSLDTMYAVAVPGSLAELTGWRATIHLREGLQNQLTNLK